MSDTYGSVYREKCKESMSRPAGYLSRRAPFCERHSIGWFQRVIVTMIMVGIVVEVAWQIALKVRP